MSGEHRIGISFKAVGPIVAFRTPMLFGVEPLVRMVAIAPAKRLNEYLIEAKLAKVAVRTFERAADVWIECVLGLARVVAEQLLCRRFNERSVQCVCAHFAKLDQVDLVLGQ